MRYFIFTILLLAISSVYGVTQDIEQDQCQRTGNKNTREIKKRYPFDKATSIKIVSFKTLDEEAVEYEIPKANGQVDFSKLIDVKSLNRRQTSKLLDILVNVNYIPLVPVKADSGSGYLIEREKRVTMCYTPRHAILFENENGQVFSYIEICLECLRYKTQPDNLEVGEFCYEKYTMLEDFFRDVGIVYGIGQNGMKWMGD